MFRRVPPPSQGHLTPSPFQRAPGRFWPGIASEQLEEDHPAIEFTEAQSARRPQQPPHAWCQRVSGTAHTAYFMLKLGCTTSGKASAGAFVYGLPVSWASQWTFHGFEVDVLRPIVDDPQLQAGRFVASGWMFHGSAMDVAHRHGGRFTVHPVTA